MIDSWCWREPWLEDHTNGRRMLTSQMLTPLRNSGHSARDVTLARRPGRILTACSRAMERRPPASISFEHCHAAVATSR
jgi:hypothetical protein